jgi:type IV secretory pathway VirB2 component (pilin)
LRHTQQISLLLEAQMLSRWFQVHLIRPLQSVLRSKWTHPTVVLLALLLLMPAAALAQGGSPFDSGFTAIQALFTGTIAKVASLVAIVIGGYGFAHGEPGVPSWSQNVGGFDVAMNRFLRRERSRGRQAQ